MLEAIMWYIASVVPFYRAMQDAGIDMCMQDLRLVNQSLNPPKE